MSRLNCCALCSSNEHSIQSCPDPLIDESFRCLIMWVDPFKPELVDSDFEHIYEILNEYSYELVCAMSIQKSSSIGIIVNSLEATREYHISNIIECIKREMMIFSQLNRTEQNDYIRWLFHDELMEMDESVDIIELLYNNSSQTNLPGGETVTATDADAISIAVQLETEFDSVVTEQNTYPQPLLLCLETETELQSLVECAICYDETALLNMDTFQCQHSFCHTCVMKLLDKIQGINCPFCRVSVKTIEVKYVDHYNDIEDIHLIFPSNYTLTRDPLGVASLVDYLV